MLNKLPTVSIVIAARNCKNDLIDTLKNVKSIDYPNDNVEIIVVDDASTDQTATIDKNLYDKMIKRSIRGGCLVARNTGIINSNNEIIVFIDADVKVNKNWLKKLVYPFKDKIIWATGGRINNKITMSKPLSSFIQLDADFRIRSKNSKSIQGSNSAFRRIVFKELGLLKTTIGGAGDIEIGYRILNNHKKIVFVEDAVVYHPYPSDVITYFKKGFWYGKGRTLMYATNKNLIKNDESTPWYLLIQPILIYSIPFIALFFSMYKIPPILSLLSIIPILLFNTKFIIYVFKKEFNIILHAIFYILVRITAWSFGMAYGQLILLYSLFLKSPIKTLFN